MKQRPATITLPKRGWMAGHDAAHRDPDKCGAAPDLKVWSRPALLDFISTSGTNGHDYHWLQRNA